MQKAAWPCLTVEPFAGTCNQYWYCSTACKVQHWNRGQTGAACQIPHSLICPVLSLFGGSKCDADMESVLHMCLDALALQTLQQPAPGDCMLNHIDHKHRRNLDSHALACAIISLV